MAAVVLVTPVGAPGGAERVLAGLARHLPGHGFEPHAVLLRPGPAERWFTEAGCPVRVIDAGSSRAGQLFRWPVTVAALRRLIRSTGAVAVVSNMAKAQLYGGVAARLAGVPNVYWQHLIPGDRRLDVAARRVPVAAVIGGSDAVIEAQRHQTPTAPIHKVHPGIDIDRVRAATGGGEALRARLGWGDAPAIGIVGRLEAWKGQRTFLRAAAAVSAEVPEVRVAVVGDAVVGHEGDYAAELRGLAAELGIADRTTFAGHVDDVAAWYEALDVVVHASEEPEPFGLVLVEAMALGATVVATDAGGPVEIIEDGVSGVLVPRRDPDALAGAVVSLLRHPEGRDRLGRAAAARAERFDEATMAAGIAAVLHEVT